MDRDGLCRVFLGPRRASDRLYARPAGLPHAGLHRRLPGAGRAGAGDFQGGVSSAEFSAQLAAIGRMAGRWRLSQYSISSAALAHSMPKPSRALLPKFDSRPTRIGGEAAEIRLSGNAMREVALANSTLS